MQAGYFYLINVFNSSQVLNLLIFILELNGFVNFTDIISYNNVRLDQIPYSIAMEHYFVITNYLYNCVWSIYTVLRLHVLNIVWVSII